jgi:hypothetical protein
MKIKIIKINQVLPDINGLSKQNKPYKIKHWLCDIELNEKIYKNIEIKTMLINFNIELKEYEVQQQIYNNIASYKIQKENNTYQKSYKILYTLDEYDKMWLHALEKMKNYIDKNPEFISTYIISAIEHGVKYDK